MSMKVRAVIAPIPDGNVPLKLFPISWSLASEVSAEIASGMVVAKMLTLKSRVLWQVHARAGQYVEINDHAG